MRYVAAYLLATLGGNNSPSLKDLEKILSSVGIECEPDKVNKIISELKGKNIEELIAEGSRKLASVPSGGAVAVSAVAAGGGGAAAAASSAPAKEEKKEEKKKKEESEESDEDMGFGLFD